MSIKIGDRATIRIPTFEVPQPATDKFPAFNPNMNSTFDPAAGAGPMVMPKLPVNPAAIPGYGTPDALKDVFEQMEKLPGLQAGATEEDRKAAIAQARDTLITVGRERGLDLMLNVKSNGQYSLDAFAWRKPNGEVAIIDFALASKDLSRSTKMQWLDVTNGGGASEPIFKIDLAERMQEIFQDIVKQWSSAPGFKAGSSAADRKSVLGKMRDQVMAAGKAAGLDLSPVTMPNGEVSPNQLLWKKPDGTEVVMDFAKNADDLTKDLQLQWEPASAKEA